MSRRYDDETKAAVMAALLAGQSVGEVAKAYDIPDSTIRSWKSRQLNGESVAIVATEKKAAIGDLLAEYVTENIITLREQVKLFRERDWLRGQDASDLAVLHGVLMDKEMRLLELLTRVPDDHAAQD